jgi:prophage DNA circulation protein
MSWRNKLLNASFKNISFKVSSAETSVGRRTVVHEYANRSNPYVQDLGRKATEYTIEGYIVQNTTNDFNYFTDRNRLMTAFQSFGPGVLVHPFLGVKRVSIKGQAKIKENFQEGGIVRFTATFVEAGARLPNFIQEGKEIVDNFSNVSTDQSADNFTQNMDTSGQFMQN